MNETLLTLGRQLDALVARLDARAAEAQHEIVWAILAAGAIGGIVCAAASRFLGANK